MNITLLIPTLNEEAGMRSVMPRVDRSLFEQVLVVDGGSRDRTVEVARSELEAAVAEAQLKGCRPCQSLAERDLGLSLLLREPQDRVRAYQLLQSSCHRMLEGPYMHLDARLGTHPCALAPEGAPFDSSYDTWVSREFTCGRIERQCGARSVSSYGPSE